MALKSRISSPLEAGTSILDVQNLPPHLNEALEYASKRLARKSIHVTLVVARREYQLPTLLPSSSASSSSALSSPAMSPPASSSSNSSFSTSRFNFKKLVRSNTGSSISSTSSVSSTSSAASASAPDTFVFTPSFLMDTNGPRLRWPLSPGIPLSPPPMTPSTASSTITDASGPMSPNPFGIRLIHADLLTDKQERTLRQTIERAEKKFRIGTEWLPPVVDGSACGVTSNLIRRSIVQNEVLFASDGLTLVSLDRLYTFKAALSSYSRTDAPLRLEDAVDELRRLILSRAGRKVTKSELLRSYDWLGVTDVALNDVDKMYRRAYGGPDRVGAIEGVGSAEQVERTVRELERKVDDTLAATMGTIRISKPPTPKGPVLRVLTNFNNKPLSPPREVRAGEVSNDEEEDLTARPERQPPVSVWSPISIAEVLHDDRQQTGPVTPNAYDDISPITRGEWGFLMGPGGAGAGRTAPVMTC
ncbi:hypothetical protein CGRA01v4_07360 [Colletotrichum graminicola]|uniref:DUF7582 domain-containing protein n=1 Tax=Colletotrichum graminicola (strain M1.001 / M2 / FGSC 10212) TaxID=645133 RepID=E3QC79_COLGM|nr:uncharacterized protein GLRG_03611 [Colletotrichum graminicola M1.001]EFQ28467.1 hypothetical protein GLRG_03611 [Colletotrichum graminicola M1.001]WDK16080.1 hypothetical protein CGRA01v4_07360 [Colletotrichum graminicola]